MTCRYRTNDADGRTVRRVLRSLSALAFLPEPEVIPAFSELRGEFPQNDAVRSILSSFADTYLDYNWNDVRFPIHFWNVLPRFQANQPRTTNSAEGWHYRFNSLLPGPHPPMHISIELLIEEETHWKIEADKVRGGIDPPRKLQSRQIETRLRNIVRNRGNQI